MGKSRLIISFWILLGTFSVHGLHAQQIRSNTGQYDTGMRPNFDSKLTPEERARFFTDKLRTELKLSSDTAKMVYREQLSYEKARDESVVDAANPTEYEKAVQKKLRADHLEALKQIVTEERWNLIKGQLDRKNQGQGQGQGSGNNSGGGNWNGNRNGGGYRR